MTSDEATEHIQRLGHLHARMSWLKRRLGETHAAIDATAKSIADAEKKSAAAFAVIEWGDGQ